MVELSATVPPVRPWRSTILSIELKCMCACIHIQYIYTDISLELVSLYSRVKGVERKRSMAEKLSSEQ